MTRFERRRAGAWTAIARIAVLIVAVLHGGFLALEMFYWDHPVGRAVFSMSEDFSAATAALAANQGLYNGFLAAGLAWAAWARRLDLAIFFLTCVIVAGVYGASATDGGSLRVQALPGFVALALVVAVRNRWTRR